MLIIVIYKLKSKKLNRKLRKILLDFGKPVRSGVFELRLNSKQLLLLNNQIEKIVKVLNAEDFLRIIKLCKSCEKKIVTYGNKPVTLNPLYYIV